MPSLRCSLCGINYPDDYRFRGQKCKIHDEQLWLNSKSGPDANWAARAAYLVRNAELDAEVAEIIPTIDARIVSQAGQLWIHSWDVNRSGIRHRLRDTDLVRVGKQVFEILGYVEATRLYFVRAFEMGVTDEGISELLRGA